MNELTLDDIQMVMDALTQWESAPTTNALLISVVMSSVIPPEGREKYAEEERVKMEEKSKECESRKEQSILLKAKLIGIKDKLIAESIHPA